MRLYHYSILMLTVFWTFLAIMIIHAENDFAVMERTRQVKEHLAKSLDVAAEVICNDAKDANVQRVAKERFFLNLYAAEGVLDDKLRQDALKMAVTKLSIAEEDYGTISAVFEDREGLFGTGEEKISVGARYRSYRKKPYPVTGTDGRLSYHRPECLLSATLPKTAYCYTTKDCAALGAKPCSYCLFVP